MKAKVIKGNRKDKKSFFQLREKEERKEKHEFKSQNNNYYKYSG